MAFASGSVVIVGRVRFRARHSDLITATKIAIQRIKPDTQARLQPLNDYYGQIGFVRRNHRYSSNRPGFPDRIRILKVTGCKEKLKEIKELTH